MAWDLVAVNGGESVFRDPAQWSTGPPSEAAGYELRITSYELAGGTGEGRRVCSRGLCFGAETRAPKHSPLTLVLVSMHARPEHVRGRAFYAHAGAGGAQDRPEAWK